MGEGSGALILETEEHAKARGAKIYAEVAGWGISNDAYHITGGEPEGKHALAAMQQALTAGGLSAADIKHVNAHARSEEHTSELQSRFDLVCRLLLEKKKFQRPTHDRAQSGDRYL